MNFTDVITALLLWHKIAVLKQRVEYITHRLSPDISLLSEVGRVPMG